MAPALQQPLWGKVVKETHPTKEEARMGVLQVSNNAGVSGPGNFHHISRGARHSLLLNSHFQVDMAQWVQVGMVRGCFLYQVVFKMQILQLALCISFQGDG